MIHLSIFFRRCSRTFVTFLPLLTVAAAIVLVSTAFAETDLGGTGPRSGTPKFVNGAAGVALKSGDGGQVLLLNASARTRAGSSEERIRASGTDAVYASVQGWPLDHRARAVGYFVLDDLGPNAPPPSGDDQASAEQAIKNGYVQKLAHCYATRNAVANLQSITWDPPGFSPVTGGSGTIHDADPRLGGQFLATPIGGGRWDIQYQWC
ncbi:hypothetical protein GCM10023161_42490 [Mycobacterium paraffinicum]|uniref:Secreted protein n=1 Tax=Mycobacterium paraffinicum TaxID=53378 RepID=A0ABP8F338_9MYCO